MIPEEIVHEQLELDIASSTRKAVKKAQRGTMSKLLHNIWTQPLSRLFPFIVAMAIVTSVILSPSSGICETTGTEEHATTATLRSNPEFFSASVNDRKTTLPTVSAIADDSSATVGTVTIDLDSSPTLRTGSGIVEITTSPKVVSRQRQNASLPLQVDRSTTEAMVRQLLDLEKRNLYGEAFLLACQLVRENPDSEFAYEAAIRTAIVLSHANPTQMEPEIEYFFREAMRVAALPGRFVEQLAHFYERTGKVDKYRKLVSDYEKTHTKDPDYWVTLARIYATSGDVQRARDFIEKALKQAPDAFPLVLVSARIYRELGLHERSKEIILGAVDQNYGPWQMRSLLLEFVKLPVFNPPDVALVLRAALANEVRYRVARGVADTLIRSAEEHRAFFAFQKHLTERISAKKAADVEMWLAALMAIREGEDQEAFNILISDPAKATPVIAFERASALSKHGRHQEALNILSILLAEQPNESLFRLSLAKEQVATTQPLAALETLAPITFEKLDSDERSDFLETAMTAALMTQEPPRIVDLWLGLCDATTFAELQAMGDLVVRALEGSPFAEKLEKYVTDQLSHPDRWPLYALHARLCGRRGDHRAEIASYAAYLKQAADDTQMLRFAAQLAVQYATSHFRIEASGDRHSTATLRVVDEHLSDQAIQFYRQLIALQPAVPDAYSSLMQVYQLRGEVEAAKKVAAEFVERDPESPEQLAAAASILDENGFTTDALHYYEKSLRIDPSNYAVWVKYADVLRVIGECAKAKTILQTMLERGYVQQAGAEAQMAKPYNQPLLLANLYKLAIACRETTSLVEYLSSLQSKPLPGKPEFLLSSAKLCLQLGAFDTAISAVQRLQKDYPNSPLLPESYLLLGQIWYTRNDRNKAIEVFREVEAKFPQSRAAITAGFNRAVALAAGGKIKEAIAAYRELASKYPDNDHALGALYEAAVLAYRAQKDTATCESLLTEFLATNCQDFPLRKNAKRALERLRAGQEPFPTEEGEQPQPSS